MTRGYSSSVFPDINSKVIISRFSYLESFYVLKWGEVIELQRTSWKCLVVGKALKRSRIAD